MSKKLELLSPAKNLEQGMAAISHGADAVYIGAPSFGARQAAGNSIEDIETLVRYAHIYGSKVFATVNTLLFDDELKAAEEMMWKLYNAGIDAAIVQDMGLLETHLPPVELHASTQTHNIDPRRIRFLEQVGFKRVILARETSLEQMRSLRREVTADLEAFVQGALCVCYSGQCYLSQYLTRRSGNRGACSQPCRSSYNLRNAEGTMLKHDEHLLSLKDFSAAQYLEDMIDAGITSFKIEGRLKDISYVKNVTAYYRRLLDGIMANREDLSSSGSGETHFFFEPDLQRTFNRGFTDYFLVQRHSMASRATQKSLGKKVGTVLSCNGNILKARLTEPLHAGDGICFFNADNKLDGFMVNRAENDKILANKVIEFNGAATLWRNNDFAFEKLLQGKTAERKIAVDMTLMPSDNGIKLRLHDEDDCSASAELSMSMVPARDLAKMRESVVSQLSKLGGTPFRVRAIELLFDEVPFIPSSVLNQLRRDAVEKLNGVRLAFFNPVDHAFSVNVVPYFSESLDARANIVNHKAEAFYRRHGVVEMEWGMDIPAFFEKERNPSLPLMTTKYCLRYELRQCLRHKCNNTIDAGYNGELFLENNGRRFRLFFDCNRCEMQLFATD